MTLRVAFDIGGVLSKYPEIFRPLVRKLRAQGVQIYVITDMHPLEDVLKVLRINRIGVSKKLVYSADYNKHGEGCKAVLLEKLKIDIFFDDFIGYVAVGGAPVRCLVMPDAHKPYYHQTWKHGSKEPEFGRRTYTKRKRSGK